MIAEYNRISDHFKVNFIDPTYVTDAVLKKLIKTNPDQNNTFDDFEIELNI